MIAFALADAKNNILDLPFFDKNIQTSNFQNFTMNFKHTSNDQPSNASFTTLIEKMLPLFSIFYHNIS